MKTNVIKCKFLKEGKPSGRKYTYYSDTDVEVDDLVILYARGKESDGIVTAIDVDPKEIEPFKDTAKTILGRKPARDDINKILEDVIDEQY